jgi:hypothetical protein
MNGIQPHQTADKTKGNAMKLPVPSFNARGTVAGRDGQQITSCNIFSASPPYLVSRLISSVRRPLPRQMRKDRSADAKSAAFKFAEHYCF